MTTLPPAIIFINPELSTAQFDSLTIQLFLTETIDGYTFDNRVIADGYYTQKVHGDGYRILVVRDDFRDGYGRANADIVLFAKAGLASVLFNKFGKPSVTLPLQRLNINNLLNTIKGSTDPPNGRCRPFAELPRPIRNMLIDWNDPSHVRDANPDCEALNEDWIKRK